MPATSAFRALLFDFDGVLANSEVLHCRAFQATLAEAGQTLKEEDYFSRYIHGDDLTVFKLFSADHGCGWDGKRAAELAARKSARYLELLGEAEILYPGAADLVQRVARRFPAAIVSMAARHEVEAVLRQAGLRECFAAVVTVEDVPRGKPDPAPYLTGMARLNRAVAGRDGGLVPADCLVIEDSPGGVRSGKAAGMAVAAVTHSVSADVLRSAGADHVFAGLDALSGFIDAVSQPRTNGVIGH